MEVKPTGQIEREKMENAEAVDSKILERLEELKKGEGPLSGLAKVYRELLYIQMKAKSQAVVTKPNLDESLVRERLGEGVPLLLFEDFHPDWDQVQTVFKQIIAWALRDSKEPSGESESLGNLSHNIGFLRKSTEAWYHGHSLKTLPLAQGIDEELLTSVVGATLKPFLFAYSRLLLPEVNQELWRRKYCPVCGGKPDFAYLDKEGGARWLLCSRCDGEWLFSRLECPYCGTRNQDALGYFIDEQRSGSYRLYVCEECHTYIKGIDSRAAGFEVLLPFERVVTLDLDQQGQERGYKPGWMISAGNEKLRVDEGFPIL